MPTAPRKTASKPLAVVNLKRDGAAWVATITVPGDAATMFSTSAKAHTKAAALTRAGALADQVLNNPVLSAVIPPQAVVAVKLARRMGSLAKLGQHGALKSLWGSVTGSGKARLVKALGA
jgi:hypothetical protein